VLTPEEFVKAGDELVFRCPTWSWESGDPKKAKSYLPADKQYLITRNVPCQTRVSSMECNMAVSAAGGGDGEDDDWMISNIIKATEQASLEDDFDLLDEDGEVMEKPTAPSSSSAGAAADGKIDTAAVGGNDDDDEYADIDGFEDDTLLQDDAAVGASAAGSNTNSSNNNANDDDDHVLKVRTYDLSITYDKYYQTPRVWMVGKSTTGQPLTGAQMMEDVISDYANRTVTMENHPHVSGPHASIHPCQHGKVMKAIVRNLMKSTTTNNNKSKDSAAGDEADQSQQPQAPSVEMYLFIFLKFVSSMIPTINYDFTMDVTADTSK